MKRNKVVLTVFFVVLMAYSATSQTTKAKKGNNVGDIAYDIELPTPKGDTVALNEFRGKLVLIDFWAGWCGPCRRENPNLVKAYNEFKDKNFINGKGFTVYGVSLDRDRSTWLSAIEKDNLTWTQVSDLKYWRSPYVQKFGVRGIPFNLLIDEKGKILAKNLRGKRLESTLEKYVMKDPAVELTNLYQKMLKYIEVMKNSEDYKDQDKEVDKLEQEIKDVKKRIDEIKK